jgi:hypothetical protein
VSTRGLIESSWVENLAARNSASTFSGVVDEAAVSLLSRSIFWRHSKCEVCDSLRLFVVGSKEAGSGVGSCVITRVVLVSACGPSGCCGCFGDVVVSQVCRVPSRKRMKTWFVDSDVIISWTGTGDEEAAEEVASDCVMGRVVGGRGNARGRVKRDAG